MSLVVQHDKDLVLSLQRLGLLLWCGFKPWPGNFHVLQMQPKKKKKRERENKLLSMGLGNDLLTMTSKAQATK